MAVRSRYVSPSVRPSVRREPAEDLRIAWEAVRAASWYVQQLDDLIVHYDRWAHAYKGAAEVLEGGIGRLSLWRLGTSPVIHPGLRSVRDRLIDWHTSAAAALETFEWGVAQGSLFQAGTYLLAWAEALGVEL